MLARRLEISRRSLAVLFQDVLCLLISEATIGTYHGVRQVPIQHFAPLVEMKNSGICHLLLVLSQRTELVAEFFGQHRDGAVYKVDTRGSIVGLTIYGIALLHIVRNVGNVYANFPHCLTAGGFGARSGERQAFTTDAAYRNGVVEVFSVARVDGESHGIAEILAPLYLLGWNLYGDVVRSLFHLFGIGIRQIVLCKNGAHFCIVFTLMSKDVDHLAYGAFRVLRPFHDFHHCLVAGLTAFQELLWDENIGSQRTTVGDKESEVSVHFQLAHKGVVATFEYFRHHGLSGVALSAGQHGHSDTVAIEGMARIAFRHKDALPAIVWNERVAAVALAHKRTFHHLGAHCVAVVTAIVTGYIIVENEIINNVEHQHFLRMIGSMKFLKEFSHLEIFRRVLFEEL